MADIQIGTSYTLTRPTFLLKGVFVLQGSKVEVQAANDDGTFTVLYIDREGFQHTLVDIKGDELT